MGPPFFNDGKSKHAKACVNSAKGFNGAAVLQRRKAYGSNDCPLPRICFNGAAVLQRRKEDVGQQMPARRVQLQWGRRSSTTERGSIATTSRAIGRFNGAAVLQRRKANANLLNALSTSIASMGPPFFNDGKVARSVYPTRQQVASMGPPFFNDGKPGMTAYSCGLPGGFNGAAVLQRRKGRAGRGSDEVHRGFNGAAVLQRRKVNWASCGLLPIA